MTVNSATYCSLDALPAATRSLSAATAATEGIAMPFFMCSHTFKPGAMTDDVMQMFASAAQAGAPVRGYRSFMNLSEGRIVCVVEAPAKEDVAAWFAKMRMPYDDITKVELEGERGVIREV